MRYVRSYFQGEAKSRGSIVRSSYILPSVTRFYASIFIKSFSFIFRETHTTLIIRLVHINITFHNGHNMRK